MIFKIADAKIMTIKCFDKQKNKKKDIKILPLKAKSTTPKFRKKKRTSTFFKSTRLDLFADRDIPSNFQYDDCRKFLGYGVDSVYLRIKKNNFLKMYSYLGSFSQGIKIRKIILHLWRTRIILIRIRRLRFMSITNVFTFEGEYFFST